MSDLRKACIHITGIVQGVGFRPFVFTCASRFELNGWVRNSSAGVDIEVDGLPEKLDEFIRELKTDIPPLARIDTFDVTFDSPGEFVGFKIIESEEVSGAFQPISPDVCICPDCLRELFDPSNRRYRYPFINCTNCGPRFTIITDIPYDRPNTTMQRFEMCPQCAAEYSDPLDRRFHAQPIACPTCGPHVWLEMNEKNTSDIAILDGDEAIRAAQTLLSEGRILAVKGLGGYHLACDATNASAVDELRSRKLRVDKPFALMMLDIATVEKHCYVTPDEQVLLESRQRPVVLLERKPTSLIAAGIAPGQHKLGVMLPYTPLHYLLLSGPNLPFAALVMTSGNLSEEPIATGNIEARQRLSVLADAFLMHDRDIHTRCDDSVVRIFNKNLFVLRRSRGYAPDSLSLPFDVPSVLATGPELKNTFCLTRGRYAFLSHHIGDMENYETYRSFEQSVVHFERLFRIQPELIAYDLHPDYFSTRYALKRAGTENLPVVGVQHHHAHIAACMADNGLAGDHPLIGIAFDGTGYGDDGKIWGGEFLLADYAGYKRAWHLGYFPLPGGDASIKRPSRTALSLLWSLGLDWEEYLAPCSDLSHEECLTLRTQLDRGLNVVQTSSMGRLFDAAAALAGIRQEVNYEAQAAIEFEAAVDRSEMGLYRFEFSNGVINVKDAMIALLGDIRKGVPVGMLAARFHNGITDLVGSVCKQIRADTGFTEVALSGGVWQNTVLLERVIVTLQRDGFTVFLHKHTPVNDGGLSLGQALVGAARFISK